MIPTQATYTVRLRWPRRLDRHIQKSVKCVAAIIKPEATNKRAIGRPSCLTAKSAIKGLMRAIVPKTAKI